MNSDKDTTETNVRKPLTETCRNCGGSGLVRCYDCEHGYKVNSWGDQVMCDCDENFKRECRHCAGTGEVEVEAPATEQQPDQPLFTDRELRSLDKLDGRNLYDHPLSPRLKALVHRAKTEGYMVQRGMMAHQITIYVTETLVAALDAASAASEGSAS